MAKASATLAVPDKFSASAKATDVTCNDDSGNAADGKIDVTITGGVSPFTYSWTGPTGFTDPKTKDLSGLSIAGKYEVTVTDATNSCVAKASATLAVPTKFSASAKAQDESCVGSDGSIDATISGGVGTLTYSWTGPGNYTASTEDISGITAGTYYLTVTDGSKCVTKAQATVNPPTDCNQLFPTQTDCNAYLNCDTSQFVQEYLCMTVKKQKGDLTITNLYPGAFFYFGDFELDVVPAGPITVQVVQEVPENLGPILYFNDANVRVHDGDCGNVTIDKVTTNYDEPTRTYYVNITYTPTSLFNVIEVKYDSKSNVGRTFPKNFDVTTLGDYQFGLKVNGTPEGTSFGSLAMNTDPNCVDTAIPPSGNCDSEVSSTELFQSTQSFQAESFVVEEPVEETDVAVYPVPFSDVINVDYEFDYSSDVTIQIFDFGGNLLRTVEDNNVSRGSTTSIAVDFSISANQMYVVRVSTDREQFVKQIVSSKK